MKAAPLKATRVRWMMAMLVFTAMAISYIDRANLGVAMPYLEREYHLGPAAQGALFGAFFWTYALCQLPLGWAVDRLGARIVYAGAVIWWSFCTAATALGRGFTSLFVMRALLGVGEAPSYPSSAKVVSEWFPRQERAFATAISDSGTGVGTALSLPIVTALIGAFGWRLSFVVTGAVGLVWAVIWIVFYRPPAAHPWVSQAERQLIDAGNTVPVGAQHGGGAAIRWRHLFRYRTIWGMMLGLFCLNFVVYFFITWFPSYLVKARGFDLLQLGLFGTIPALAGIPAGYLGGLASDAMVRRGARLTMARKIPIVLGLGLSSCIALAVIVPGAAAALALLSLSYAGVKFAAPSILSLPSDLAPTKQHVASIGGIQNCAANLAGICVAQFVGVMLAKTGGFVVPLVVAGGFALLGVCSYIFIVGPIEPLRVEKSVRDIMG